MNMKMKKSLQMNSAAAFDDIGPVASVEPGPAGAKVLLVCEHASSHIPEQFGGLGLPIELQQSHIAWDPGALGVARAMAAVLEAPLVRGCISRLVYDCNRPPEVESSIPAKSEIYEIPGNSNLSEADRTLRVASVYAPFRRLLGREIHRRKGSVQSIVTVHSFTPIFHGRKRDVEVGILHGQDPGFARAMMASVPEDLNMVARLNEPYSAADGVAHTLDVHGVANGFLNVMIEIRNDLIQTKSQQEEIGAKLASWISDTLADTSK